MARKKKLNKRLVLLISVVLVAGLGVGFVGWILRRPKDPKHYRDLAAKALEASPKKYERAGRMFQIAINESNDNPKQRNKYRCDYAQMCFDRMKNDPAMTKAERDALPGIGIGLLKKAIEDDPDSIDSVPARRILADLFWASARGAEGSKALNTVGYAHKQWTNLVEQLDEILKLQQDPELYYRRAVAGYHLGKDDTDKKRLVLDDFRKAIAISKIGDENLQYRLALASYLQLLDDKAEAEKEYKDAIKANPKNAKAYLGYSNFLFREKRNKDALKEIDSAITNDPTSANGYLARAQIYAQKREFDKALDVLKMAQKEGIADISIYNMEGLLYRGMGKLQDSAASYRSALDAVDKKIAENASSNNIRKLESDKVRLSIQLAKVMLAVYRAEKDKTSSVAKNAMNEAEKCNELLLKLIPDNPEQLKIAGRIAFDKGDLNQAQKYAEQARELRDEYALNNQLKQTVDPELTSLLLGIYERNRFPSKAKIEIIRLLGTGYGTPKQKVLYALGLAGYELNDGNYQRARNIVNKILDTDPNNEKARSFSRSLDIAEEKVSSSGVEVDSVSRNVMYRLAQKYTIEERYDEAAELLERLLKSDPKNKQILQWLISLLMQTDKKDQAFALVDKAIKDSPDDKGLIVWRDILQTDDPEKVFEIQMKAAEEIEDPVDRNLQKWRFCVSAKRDADAEKYFKQAEEANPSDSRVIEIAFKMAIQNKKWDRAQEIINRLDKNEKVLRNMYSGRLFLAQEKYDDAIASLKGVLEIRPNLQQVRLLLANCYLKKEDFNNAEKQLLIIVDNDSSNVAALAWLAKLAAQKQNTQDFEKWIRMAHKHNAGKADPFVREAFLTFEVEKTDRPKAIAQREKEFKKNKSNLQNAARLATLYEQEKQIDKAQKMYEYIFTNMRTQDKVSFSPIIAGFYSRIGQLAKGREIFDSLLKTVKTPKERARMLAAYGDFFANTNDVSSAEELYKKAIEADSEDSLGYRGLANCYAFEARGFERLRKKPQAKSAWNRSIAQLQQVIRLEPNDITIQKLMHSRQVNAENYSEAIDGFQSILKSDPQDKGASLAIAQIYQIGREYTKALTQLDGIIKKHSRYAEAYANRAKVYESIGELKKADVDYRKALDITNNPVWARDRARLNIRIGDRDQAMRIYTETISAFPDYIDTYIGKLQLLMGQKNWNQVKLLAEKGMLKENFARVPNFALAMAEVWKQQRQPRKELEMLKKAAQIAPGNQRIISAYLKALAVYKAYDVLQTEAKKYIDNPKQKAIVMGILAFADARKDPKTGALNEFLAALKASGPNEISYVLSLMQEAMGPQGLTTNVMQLKKIHPDSWEIPFAIAQAYTLQKKYPHAIKEYDNALSLAKNPQSQRRVLFDMARSYSELKYYAKTEETYRRLLEIDPNDKAALNNLAYVLVDNLKRPKEALPLSKRALRLEPGNINVLDTYAWILVSMGEYKEAMSAYDEIKDRKIKSPDVLYHIAFVAEKLEQYEVAKEYYQLEIVAAQMNKNDFLIQQGQQGLKRVKQKLSEE